MKKSLAFFITAISLLGFQFASTASEADAFESAFSIKEVESAPVPVSQQGPEMTADIKGIAAVVHVSFVIGNDGTVTAAKILKSTDARVEPAAMETVKKWKFKPAKNQGADVSVRAVVPIRFNA